MTPVIIIAVERKSATRPLEYHTADLERLMVE